LYAQLEAAERDLFNASFDRCLETCEIDIHFISFFYSKLSSSNTEIAAIIDSFPLSQRIHALRHSIYVLIEFSEGRKTADELSEIACLHLLPGIKPFMLDLWLSSLLLSVAEYDGAYSPEIQSVWYRVMKPGIDLLKSLIEQRQNQELKRRLNSC
jgi:hypothetical protein